MKRTIVVFFGLVLILLACSKNQRFINDIEGDWVLLQIAFEKAYQTQDSIVQYQNVVLRFKECDKDQNKSPRNCGAVLIDGDYVIEMNYQVTSTKGATGLSLFVDETNMTEGQILKTEKVRGSHFQEFLNNNEEMILEKEYSAYVNNNGERVGLKSFALFRRN